MHSIPDNVLKNYPPTSGPGEELRQRKLAASFPGAGSIPDSALVGYPPTSAPGQELARRQAQQKQETGTTAWNGSGGGGSTGGGGLASTPPPNIDTDPNEVIYTGEYSFIEGDWNFSVRTPVTNFDNIAETISGIFGLPYQFSDIVDPPIDTASGLSNIGRKYGEKIFSIMPILFLTPGEPIFMPGSRADKQTIANAWFDRDSPLDLESMHAGGAGGRYYIFRSMFSEYKQYANIALTILASYMGIADVEIPVPGKSQHCRLGSIDVEDFMNNSFTKMFGVNKVVPFYVDAEKSISESFSNQTTESMISQTVNGFSQTAREIQFIMGSKDYGGVMKSIGGAIAGLGANFAGAMGDLGTMLAGDNLLSRVTNELTTIVAGGKIIFPEIWSGSDFDRNYQITLKLRSPDPDPVSIFLNIYMPIVMLVAMAAPRQIYSSYNAYQSPFLVRATYKSIFNCDLGIISQLDIEKGGEGCWNVMGHPTQANVTISIKDLYKSMFVSKTEYGAFRNTSEMDYLSLMAGVDMNADSDVHLAKLRTLYNMMRAAPGRFIDRRWSGIKESINWAGTRVLDKLGMDTRWLT